MTGGFEAETAVGAGDDDGLVGEGGCGVGQGDEKLGVEEGGYVRHGGRIGGGCSVIVAVARKKMMGI